MCVWRAANSTLRWNRVLLPVCQGRELQNSRRATWRGLSVCGVEIRFISTYLAENKNAETNLGTAGKNARATIRPDFEFCNCLSEGIREKTRVPVTGFPGEESE